MVSDDTKVYSWLWGIAVLYILLNLLVGSGISSLLSEFGSIVITLVLFGFALLYGSTRYGWRGILTLFAITAVLSWTMETLSIATGFPFGHYVYTDNLGPKLGTVSVSHHAGLFRQRIPCLDDQPHSSEQSKHGNLSEKPGSGASYRGICHGHVGFLHRPGHFNDRQRLGVEGRRTLLRRAHIELLRLVSDGIPDLPCFVLYLDRNECRKAQTSLPKRYWLLAPVMYFGTATLTLIHPFVLKSHADIYWSMFLAAMMTMVFVSILAIVLISRFDE